MDPVWITILGSHYCQKLSKLTLNQDLYELFCITIYYSSHLLIIIIFIDAKIYFYFFSILLLRPPVPAVLGCTLVHLYSAMPELSAAMCTAVYS